MSSRILTSGAVSIGAAEDRTRDFHAAADGGTLRPMSGYAAVARIRSVSPHFAGGTALGRGDLLVPPAAVAETDAHLVTAPDDPLPTPAPGLGERWTAARERWSQLTFYLTDPNSWR